MPLYAILILEFTESRQSMNILITGPSGLIGSALIEQIQKSGDTFTGLTRSTSSLFKSQTHWDPERGEIELNSLEDHGAVVHLAGETITGRWTPEKKLRIRKSRLLSTALITESVSKLKAKPAVVVGASAVGYYGSRGDEVLTEDSEPGEGFFADLCVEWEALLEPLIKAGIRVVNLRIGVVLSKDGGALKEMLPPFKLGLGGRIGDGRQYWSWIALQDVIGAIYHCIKNEEVRGPVNIVAPGSVTNSDFTKNLGEALGRPTVLSLPSFAARAIFGEMADEALLSSVRVEPKKLLDTGYKFKYVRLSDALEGIL
jgi:uncharacterized protein